jgi:hypothetical protein
VEDGFDYLQGTQRHEKILAQNHVSTHSHTGAKATEEAQKKMRKKYKEVFKWGAGCWWSEEFNI